MVQTRRKLWQILPHLFLSMEYSIYYLAMGEHDMIKNKILQGQLVMTLSRKLLIPVDFSEIHRSRYWWIQYPKIFSSIMITWWMLVKTSDSLFCVLHVCAFIYLFLLEYYFQILTEITVSFWFWPTFFPLRGILGYLKL